LFNDFDGNLARFYWKSDGNVTFQRLHMASYGCSRMGHLSGLTFVVFGGFFGA
jgi:hypothetical protein